MNGCLDDVEFAAVQNGFADLAIDRIECFLGKLRIEVTVAHDVRLRFGESLQAGLFFDHAKKLAA